MAGNSKPFLKKLTSKVNFVRNIRAMDELELFLVMGVTAILTVRILLDLTGYPQLGGRSLHIAHMLWGGLLMLAAALFRLMLLGKWVEYVSAFFGGIGFGLFIDEIGKFVTQDNNYFFAPSFSLMYIVFVLIYLVAHWVLNKRRYTKTEYLMNSVNQMLEVRNGFLREDEKKEIQIYLEKSDQSDPLAIALKDFTGKIETVPTWSPGFFARMMTRLSKWYMSIIKSRLFLIALYLFFISQLVGQTVYIFIAIFYPQGFAREAETPNTSEWFLFASNTLAAFFILWGLIQLPRSRYKAYKAFERYLLVTILLSQVLLFTINQLGAITGLFFYLTVLGGVRFLISQEENKMISEHDHKIPANLEAT